LLVPEKGLAGFRPGLAGGNAHVIQHALVQGPQALALFGPHLPLIERPGDVHNHLVQIKISNRDWQCPYHGNAPFLAQKLIDGSDIEALSVHDKRVFFIYTMGNSNELTRYEWRIGGFLP
jgi:hypothetical protein